MGGSSVPSSTYQQQNLVTGLWAVPELKKRALKLLDPALQYTGEQQAMMLGVNKNDPAALRKFYGLSGTAPVSDVTAAMREYGVTKAPSSYTGPVPLKSAAQGGVMGLFDERRRYAEGGSTKALTQAQQATVQKINKAIANGTVTQAQIDNLNKIEKATNKNVSPYSNVGTSEVQNKATAAAINKGLEGYQASPAGKEAAADTAALTAAAKDQRLTPADAYLGQGGMQGLGAYDPATRTWELTNPALVQAQANLTAMQQAPSQFAQSTDIMTRAAQGLGGLAGYQPQQISAPSASAAQASAYGYDAASMQAPEAAQVQDYQAALAQANQMQRPEDVSAERMAVSQMTKPEDVQSKALEYFQMQGPGSWTDEGVSQKYMSPYMQGVIDIAKREKGRDYSKQLNALNAQAMAAGAFGGGRQAMERSQAARDYQQQLQDLETQGLQQAYQQGMSQYGAESALGQQANIQNLQALLGVQSQEAQQALQAALANQAAGLTTEQQNLASRNLAGQANQQTALQAALANQAAGLTTGQANLNAAQATSLANQQAINNQRQQYVQNALQAEMQRYGGQLTTAQQNMLAQMAAAQFNAQAQNQASLSNATMGTQVNLANAANALQAGMANQAAGLQGNQQGIAAYGAMGNMGQGIGALGTNLGNYNMNVTQGWGNLGSGLQNMYTNAANQMQQNAGNVFGAPMTLANQGLGAMQGMGGGQGGAIIQQTNTGR